MGGSSADLGRFYRLRTGRIARAFPPPPSAVGPVTKCFPFVVDSF